MAIVRLSTFALTMVLAVSMTACGSNSAVDSPALTAVGEQGKSLARSKGCAACHGSEGQGGVGPAFVGLWGSEVEFAEGKPGIADEAYIRESIIDPRARTVAGYSLPMPVSNLSDDEIDLLVTYIEELGAPTEANP